MIVESYAITENEYVKRNSCGVVSRLLNYPTDSRNQRGIYEFSRKISNYHEHWIGKEGILLLLLLLQTNNY